MKSFNSGGGVFLVSSEPKSLSLLRVFQFMDDILGNHRTEVAKSFMRSFNSRGRYIWQAQK